MWSRPEPSVTMREPPFNRLRPPCPPHVVAFPVKGQRLPGRQVRCARWSDRLGLRGSGVYRARSDLVRLEEDAGFLPRRDGTGQSRCCGAVRRPYQTGRIERRAGAEGPDPPLRRPGRPRRPLLHGPRGPDVRLRRPQRRRQDHRHADRAGRAGGRRRAGLLARQPDRRADPQAHRLHARRTGPNVSQAARIPARQGHRAAVPSPRRGGGSGLGGGLLMCRGTARSRTGARGPGRPGGCRQGRAPATGRGRGRRGTAARP
jgi:hypothetical protein